MQLVQFRCSSKKTKYSTDVEDFCVSVEFGAVGAVRCSCRCSSKKQKYSTDVEDFCVSVEFGAVGAVGAVKF